MDVRIAFNELLLNRAKIRVREQSVGVLREEVKTQQERLTAGIVGTLNVSRAEVALANEQPELIDAQTSGDTTSKVYCAKMLAPDDPEATVIWMVVDLGTGSSPIGVEVPREEMIVACAIPKFLTYRPSAIRSYSRSRLARCSRQYG